MSESISSFFSGTKREIRSLCKDSVVFMSVPACCRHSNHTVRRDLLYQHANIEQPELVSMNSLSQQITITFTALACASLPRVPGWEHSQYSTVRSVWAPFGVTRRYVTNVCSSPTSSAQSLPAYLLRVYSLSALSMRSLGMAPLEGIFRNISNDSHENLLQLWWCWDGLRDEHPSGYNVVSFWLDISNVSLS